MAEESEVKDVAPVTDPLAGDAGKEAEPDISLESILLVARQPAHR